MRGAPSAEIRSLTGLRFIAALSVAFTHYAINAHATIFGLAPELAGLGMQLFFTLSGFVIHYVYSQSFAASPQRAVKAFAIARFSRLYPLFFLFFVFYLLFRTLGQYVSSPGTALSYITLTATWWYWQVDGHTMMEQPYGFSWSISTESFFYLCYAVALYRIARITRWRVCVAGIGGLALLGCFLVWFASHYSPTWEPFVLNTVFQNGVAWAEDPKNSVLFWLIGYSPYFTVMSFAVGCLTAQLYMLCKERNISHRTSDLLFVMGAIWVIVFLFLYLRLVTNDFMLWGGRISFPKMNVISSSFVLVSGLASVILALALGCVASRFFSAAPLVLLGEASYSLYLGHPIMISAVGVQSETFRWPSLVIALALACFFAIGAYRAFELPAKRMVRAKLMRAPVATASDPAPVPVRPAAG